MFCQFEDCKMNATKTWGLLPLCADHHETIRKETAKFYKGAVGKEEPSQRPLYYKIDLRIAWSKRNLLLKRGERI